MDKHTDSHNNNTVNALVVNARTMFEKNEKKTQTKRSHENFLQN